MKRPVGYGSLHLAVVLAVTARYAEQLPLDGDVSGLPTALVASLALSGAAIVFGSYGLYMLTKHVLVDNAPTKRRGHDVRNVLRLAFGVATLIALLGVLTQQWVGVLFSLGIVGFFARAPPARMIRGA